MNSEYFLIRPSSLSASRYSFASSFRYSVISVPRPSVLPSGSTPTLNVASADDSQMCCTSSSFFDRTTTRSATRYTE